MDSRDIESVFVVLLAGWISAAGILAYHGKLNIFLLLMVIGVITVVVVLSSGLSLISAIAIRRLSSHYRRG